MLLFGCILLVMCVSSQSRSSSQAVSYRPQHRPHISHHQGYYYHPSNPLAQDRKFHWVKHFKKQQKHKFKSFKKHFKKCGFPFAHKFKLFKRSDGKDLDTVQIMIPYGYGDEYYPRREAGDLKEVLKPPPAVRVLHSVKYRHYPKKGALEWRPSVDTNDGISNNLESSGIRNGTDDGIL